MYNSILNLLKNDFPISRQFRWALAVTELVVRSDEEDDEEAVVVGLAVDLEGGEFQHGLERRPVIPGNVEIKE